MRHAVVLLLVLWAADARADDVARVRAHLAFAHDVLAHRDVSQLSSEQQDARAAALADLSRYIERGVFPRRTGDAYGALRPRFIDDRGVHCAVGEMIAASGAEALARAINARYEYAYVREMDMPALATWATAHGFTVDELALIQPSYSGLPTPDGVRREINDAKEHLALACAQKHPAMNSLLIVVQSNQAGAMLVSTKSTDPFAQCFVQLASQIDRGGHAYEGSPREFAIGMDLSFTSPQKLLAERIARWSPRCMPRPGAIAREALVSVTSTSDGFVIDAKTTPSNALVESCLKDEGKKEFWQFGSGVWSLHATKKIALPPHVQIRPETLTAYASDVATDCNPSPAPNAVTTITITAKPDDERFRFTATGTADFSTCVSEKLNKRFTEMYRVSYLDAGKRIDFFRVDADVNVSVTIKLESAAAKMKRLEAEQQEAEHRRNHRMEW
jgi:hypothetical protein